MDGNVRRVVEEVATELGVETGFLIRVIELEEGKAHLTRRRGLFSELREISHKAAARSLDAKLGDDNED